MPIVFSWLVKILTVKNKKTRTKHDHFLLFALGNRLASFYKRSLGSRYGLPESKLDQKGQRLWFFYDGNHRLLRIESPQGTVKDQFYL